MRYYIHFFLLLASTTNLYSQLHPVQVTTQLSPPYSLYLSDYVAPGSERLALNVFLGDISQPQFDIKFRLKIEGQGILIQTKQEYNPPPVTVQGGVPLRLIGADLIDYFNPTNLSFSGISRAQYEQAGKLPEGVYRFCFEVLEYTRGIQISATSCAVAWLVLNDPPLINLPKQNEKIRPLEPQNVVIQWTPRHSGSPNSAFLTEYDLEMVEVWPTDRNPNDAILSSQPILKTTTRSTTFIYGPSEVPLMLGRRYAFRVRAKAMSEIDELDLFKNNGYSEVYSFIYGDDCGLPLDVTAIPLNSSRIKIEWDILPKHSTFIVRYREVGTSNWYGKESGLNSVIINSLKPSTRYEYQVAGICGQAKGEFSPTAYVSTLELSKASFACGIPMKPFDIDPSKLTGSLQIGDVIEASDFEVELTQVSGSGGTFSGEGFVVMPMMNLVKVKVKFVGITVAHDKEGGFRMVKGMMEVIGGEVNIIPDEIMDVVELVEQGLDYADSALTIIDTYLPREGPDPDSFASDTLVVIDGNILAVVPNHEDGTVYVTTTDGKTTELPAGTSYAVVDKAGHGHVIDKKGNTTKTTAAQAQLAANREYNFSVDFVNAEGSKHGFDKWDGNAQLKSTYETLDEAYVVSWKAIDAASGDIVVATITKNNLNSDRIRFEMIGVDGTASHQGGNKWSIQLTSGNQGKIIVYYSPSGEEEKEQILGKLNVQGVILEKRTLVIVKDNNAEFPFENAQNLEVALNQIYGQAGMNWQVSYEEISLGVDKNFDAKESDLLTNYTSDMKGVINSYGSFQEDVYYLFVIEKPTNAGDITGFMPRSKQVGFLYTSGNTSRDQFVHSAAHELGHGAFALRHPFLEFDGLAEKATQNLMDYSGPSANHLMRFQWIRVHDPVTVMPLLDSDEEAANIATNQIPEEWLFMGETFNCVTPTGKKISLPGNAVVEFSYGIKENNLDMPIGYLASFTIKEKEKSVTYSAKITGVMFDGYYSHEKGEYYKDTLSSQNNNSHMVMPIPNATYFSLINFRLEDGEFEPYKNDTEIPSFFDFPIRPFLNITAEKESKLQYGEIGGIYAHQGEQWTLKLEYIGELLDNHAQRPEYNYVLKLVELRTAYPKFFNDFVRSWDKWYALKQTVTNSSNYQNFGITPSSSIGDWEKMMLADEKLYDSWKDDPVNYYRTLVKEFIRFIERNKINASSFFEKDLMVEYRKSESKSEFIKQLSKILQSMSNDDIENAIDYYNRVAALTILIKRGYTDDIDENQLIRLIKYIPTDQVSELLTELLISDELKPDRVIIKSLADGIDGDNFVIFMSLITQYLNKISPIDYGPDQIIKNKTEGRYFSFDPSWIASGGLFFRMKTDGSIIMTQTGFFGDKEHHTVNLEPYELVTLHFKDSKSLSFTQAHEGDVFTTYAVFAYAIVNAIQNENNWTTVNVTLQTALMATGVGSIITRVATIGMRGLLTAKTAAVVIDGVGIAIDAVYRDKWEQDEEYKKILEAWDVFDRYYTIGSFGTDALKILREARTIAQKSIRLNKESTEIYQLTLKMADEIIALDGKSIEFLDILKKFYVNEADAEKVYKYFVGRYSSLQVKAYGKGLVNGQEELIKLLNKFKGEDLILNPQIIDAFALLKSYPNLRVDRQALENLLAIFKKGEYSSLENLNKLGDQIENSRSVRNLLGSIATSGNNKIDLEVPINSFFGLLVELYLGADGSFQRTKNFSAADINDVQQKFIKLGYTPLKHATQISSHDIDLVFWNGSKENPFVFFIGSPTIVGEYFDDLTDVFYDEFINELKHHSEAGSINEKTKSEISNELSIVLDAKKLGNIYYLLVEEGGKEKMQINAFSF